MLISQKSRQLILFLLTILLLLYTPFISAQNERHWIRIPLDPSLQSQRDLFLDVNSIEVQSNNSLIRRFQISVQPSDQSIAAGIKPYSTIILSILDCGNSLLTMEEGLLYTDTFGQGVAVMQDIIAETRTMDESNGDQFIYAAICQD